MNLSRGDRIEGGPRSAYVIAGEGRVVSRHVAYPARKVFWNARTAAGRVELFEADPEEWLAVLVRVPTGDAGPDCVRFEAETVLALPGATALPEPLDVIEDVPAGALLVVSDVAGRPLSEACPEPSSRAAFLDELRLLLDRFHDAGLVVGPLDTSDFAVDAAGRWTFLGTDRVRRSASPADIRSDRAHLAEFVERLDPKS